MVAYDRRRYALREALSEYDRRNLDELDEFDGEGATCERVARAFL